MGAFFTSLQVRARDAAAVADALEPILTSGLAWIAPAANGWVSVYPESTEKQDLREMESLAAALSAALPATVLGVLVHDGDVVRLWAFVDGALRDEFESDPDYFQPATKADRERLRGRPEVLAALGPANVSPAAVADALAGRGLAPQVVEAQLEQMKQRLLAQLAELKKTKPKLARQFEGQVETMLARLTDGGQPVTIEARLAAFAELIGIPASRALCGFNDIEAGQTEISGLLLIPEARAARRKAQREAQERRRVMRWDAQRAAGELCWAHERPRRRGKDYIIRALGFTADGRFWIAEAEDANAPQWLTVLDPDGRQVARHPHEGVLWTSMSPGGDRIAAAAGPRRPIVVRRTSDLEVVQELPPTPRGLGAVHLPRAGAFVAVDDFDGALTFYRAGSGELGRRADIRGANVRACGWSTDGARFMRIDGGEVIVSRLPDGGDTLIRSSRHGIRAFAACDMPDGERLLVAGDGGAGIFTSEGELERKLTWTLVGPERAEAFDRMAQLLTAGGSRTTGSDLVKAQPQLAQSGRAVIATDRWLAVLGADGIVRLWSTDKGELIGRRDTQQALQWEMLVAPGADRLVTGGNPVLCWIVG